MEFDQPERCFNNAKCVQAITEMVRQLREGKGKTGLVLANGGVVTYQAAVCLSSSPRRDGLPYPDTNPIPDIVTDVQVPPVDEKAEGDAVIEVSWTLTLNWDRQLRAPRRIQSTLIETVVRSEVM